MPTRSTPPFRGACASAASPRAEREEDERRGCRVCAGAAWVTSAWPSHRPRFTGRPPASSSSGARSGRRPAATGALGEHPQPGPAGPSRGPPGRRRRPAPRPAPTGRAARSPRAAPARTRPRRGARVASSKRRPTIWSPMGSPSRVKPHGTDAAGWPVRLKGYVYGNPPVRRHGLARDLARVVEAERERRARDRRRQQEVVALEERARVLPPGQPVEPRLHVPARGVRRRSPR